MHNDAEHLDYTYEISIMIYESDTTQLNTVEYLNVFVRVALNFSTKVMCPSENLTDALA